MSDRVVPNGSSDGTEEAEESEPSDASYAAAATMSATPKVRRRPDPQEQHEESPHGVPLRRDTRMTLEPLLGASETMEEEEEEKEEKRTERWWVTLVSGGIAGAVSRTCVAPLERLKILFQVQGLSAKGAPLRHKGIWESLWNLYEKDGLRGLWKGNGMNCIRVVPSSAIQFASYRFYKHHLFGDDGTGEVHLSPWQHVVAGGMAGATSTTMTYPLDLMRARRTVDFRGDVPMGMVSGLVHIARTEGFRGMYRGLIPSLCGIIPYIGIDMMVYHQLKHRAIDAHIGLDPSRPHDLSPVTKLLCGAGAGVCGMTVAFPFDTVRRNLQVATLKFRDGSPPPPSMFHFFADTLRRDGPTALYRGILPNYMKAAPSVGISFATFESVKPYFGEEHLAQPSSSSSSSRTSSSSPPPPLPPKEEDRLRTTTVETASTLGVDPGRRRRQVYCANESPSRSS